MKRMYGKILTIFATGIFLMSLGSAAWNIEVLDKPHNTEKVSNISQTVRLVNLTKDGKMIDEESLEDDFDGLDMIYRYGVKEPKDQMQHLSEGYWFANFTANYSKGKIEYELENDVQDITQQESLERSNYSVSFLNSPSGTVEPGSTTEVRIDVRDEWNNQPEQEARANVYFTNVSETLRIQTLGNQDISEYYNNAVEIPKARGEAYVMHVNVTNTTVQPLNSTASISKVVRTAPPLRGHIEKVTSSMSDGCENSSFFRNCERNATIEIGFNSTGDSINSINLSMMKFENQGSEVTNQSIGIELKNGLYQGEFNFPILNTSRYEREVSLVFNASIPSDRLITRYNITYSPFEVFDKSENRVDQGGSYEFRVSPETPYSSSLLELNNLEDLNVSITHSGSEFDFYQKEDMTEYQQSGFIGRDVSIPADASTGTYNYEVNITNEFGYERELSGSFNVEAQTQVFDVNDSINMDLIDLLEHKTSFTVDNMKNTKLELNIVPEGDLKDITEVNSSVNVSSNGKKVVNITFLPEEVESVEGDILVNDTELDFSRDINVDLNEQDCERINGSLCLDHGKWMNKTLVSRGSVLDTFNVEHPRDGNLTVDILEVSDPGDVLNFTPKNFKLEDSREIVLNYTARSPGNYTAKLDVASEDYSLPFMAHLELNADPLESSATVPESIDLGTVSSGSDTTSTVPVTNTGDYKIFSVGASSNSYSVTATNTTIPPGDSKSVPLGFTNVQNGAGTISLDLKTSTTTLTKTVSASTSLSTPQTGTGSDNGSDGQESDDGQNDSQEENPFQDDDQQDQQEGSETGEETEAGGTTGEGTGDSISPDPGKTEDSGGGSGILPIAAALIVVLIIVFVFYTSYIPEEGDPLYSVLGGE